MNYNSEKYLTSLLKSWKSHFILSFRYPKRDTRKTLKEPHVALEPRVGDSSNGLAVQYIHVRYTVSKIEEENMSEEFLNQYKHIHTCTSILYLRMVYLYCILLYEYILVVLYFNVQYLYTVFYMKVRQKLHQNREVSWDIRSYRFVRRFIHVTILSRQT